MKGTKQKIHFTHEYSVLCSTCKYWMGDRDIKNNASNKLGVYTFEQESTCKNNDSTFGGARRKYNQKCNNYQRLRDLSKHLEQEKKK